MTWGELLALEDLVKGPVFPLEKMFVLPLANFPSEVAILILIPLALLR